MNKKLFIPLLLTFITAASFAQDTLTGANSNPVIGDAFILFNSDTAGVWPGAGGAAVVWNFSSLDTTGVDTAIATDCSLVSPPCTSSGLAIGSTLALVYESNNVNSYLYTGSDKIAQYGLYYSSTSYVVCLIGHPMDQIRYPFTYNSTFIDTFYGTGAYMGIHMTQYGVDTVTCDGYGTLVLPGGNTYSNVLRIHTSQTYIDSANVFGIDTNLSYQVDQYSWLMPDFHSPLLNIILTTELSSGTADKTVTWTSRPIHVVIPNNGVSNVSGIDATLKLYPNPVTDELNIGFSVPYSEQVRVSLQDMLGREIAIISNQYVSGSQNINYNTSALPSGLYLVRLESGTETITRKIEVR